MRSLRSILTPPALCLALLVGIAAQRATQLKPADAEPFHARVRAAVAAMPTGVTVNGEPWSAERQDIDEVSRELLQPNAVASLDFRETVTAADRLPRTAHLLVVQCYDSADMAGHYPPICYPGNGYTLLRTNADRTVDVDGVSVPYTEYEFGKEFRGHTRRICVYNFFAVPGAGFRRDITDVRRSAEDRQRQFFGAAQFQVVMDADYLPRAQRDPIFNALIRANAPLLAALNSAEVGKK